MKEYNKLSRVEKILLNSQIKNIANWKNDVVEAFDDMRRYIIHFTPIRMNFHTLVHAATSAEYISAILKDITDVPTDVYSSLNYLELLFKGKPNVIKEIVSDEDLESLVEQTKQTFDQILVSLESNARRIGNHNSEYFKERCYILINTLVFFIGIFDYIIKNLQSITPSTNRNLLKI